MKHLKRIGIGLALLATGMAGAVGILLLIGWMSDAHVLWAFLILAFVVLAYLFGTLVTLHDEK